MAAETATDILDLTATDQARLIREKQLSPVDLTRASLERVSTVQPALNPFCFVYEDEALAAARAAEQAVMRGDALGKLHGLPIALKDFTPTKGKRATRGSVAFENWVPEHDAVIATRLRAAGAILLGKTTTPEFAHAGFTHSRLWGVTRNPWDPTRTPGGSSGGSGAAVVAGCVSIAEGTDMGGSVRIPAAFCGCVGLKPSLGRIPMDILPTVFDNLSHFGPLARSIDDAALFLRATEGPHDADIQSQIAPLPLPARLDGDLRGVRIGLSPDLGFYAVDPTVLRNLELTAQALRDAGAVVETVAIPWTPEVSDAWIDLWRVFQAAAFGDLLETHRDRMDPGVVDLIEAGLRIDAVAHRRIEEIRTRQWRDLARVFETCDALLCPTTPIAAPPVDARDDEYYETDAAGRLHTMAMTEVFNSVAQCPALSVPSGVTAEGMPTAAQIVARRFDDPMALRIGAAIERARPWRIWRPADAGL